MNGASQQSTLLLTLSLKLFPMLMSCDGLLGHVQIMHCLGRIFQTTCSMKHVTCFVEIQRCAELALDMERWTTK